MPVIMTDTATLLAEIDAFTEATGMAETTFGKKAVNDGKFVRRLRAGRRVWPETVEKVRSFIAEHQAALPEAAHV